MLACVHACLRAGYRAYRGTCILGYLHEQSKYKLMLVCCAYMPTHVLSASVPCLRVNEGQQCVAICPIVRETNNTDARWCCASENF